VSSCECFYENGQNRVSSCHQIFVFERQYAYANELDSVYGDSAPSFTTVKFWAAEFKRGRKSLGDDERSERPKTATTD